jgi:hypothetical protein
VLSGISEQHKVQPGLDLRHQQQSSTHVLELPAATQMQQHADTSIHQ